VTSQVLIGPSNDGRRHGRGTYLFTLLMINAVKSTEPAREREREEFLSWLQKSCRAVTQCTERIGPGLTGFQHFLNTIYCFAQLFFPVRHDYINTDYAPRNRANGKRRHQASLFCRGRKTTATAVGGDKLLERLQKCLLCHMSTS
jgi:hypothetical protein